MKTAAPLVSAVATYGAASNRGRAFVRRLDCLGDCFFETTAVLLSWVSPCLAPNLHERDPGALAGIKAKPMVQTQSYGNCE